MLYAFLAEGHRLSARIAGRDEDGSPSCATVPVIGGWQPIEDRRESVAACALAQPVVERGDSGLRGAQTAKGCA